MRQTCAQDAVAAAAARRGRRRRSGRRGESVAVEFAEQFSVDVSSIGDDLRSRFTSALGKSAFRVVVLTFIADFVPRVRAGLEALGLPVPWTDAVVWDHDSDLGRRAASTSSCPAVARLRALDPVTTEVVRLRGATQHNCRLCKSRREGDALDAGGIGVAVRAHRAITRRRTLLTERHKAALRYVDALIWTPAAIKPDVAAGVRAHFTEVEAFELTLDVMRNAANKIAVSLGADAPESSRGPSVPRRRKRPDGFQLRGSTPRCAHP